MGEESAELGVVDLHAVVEIEAARFPQTKTLDEFDFGQQPSTTEPLMLELAKGQYIDSRENVVPTGSSGVGKTPLAIAPSSTRRARAPTSETLVNGSGGPQALPDPPTLGAAGCPRVSSTKPQRCLFKPAFTDISQRA